MTGTTILHVLDGYPLFQCFYLFLRCSICSQWAVMRSELTLPGLQSLLDRLQIAGSIALVDKEAERLFGYNDVAIARMKRFARGHNCVVAHADGSVVFHKLPPHA